MKKNESVWHLYPERKPVFIGEYMVTYFDKDNKKRIAVDFYGLGWRHIQGVVAWAELPEPYVGTDEAEEAEAEPWWMDNIVDGSTIKEK